jgi:hypothetical protein
LKVKALKWTCHEAQFSSPNHGNFIGYAGGLFAHRSRISDA